MCHPLYEDAHLIAVDKPAGVTVIPARDASLAQSLRGQLEAARGETLWVVHRLDRDTSGVLLFARDAQTHRALNLQFEAHRIEKSYWALAAGAPLPARSEIRLPLHAARKGRMRPALAGEAAALEAHTSLAVRARWPLPDGLQIAELDLRPHSGRQHQLRVHLRALEAPLLGDPLYRLPEVRRPQLPPGSASPPRLALHARCIAFAHPQDGRAMHIEAELPATLRDWRAALGAALPA